MIITVSVYRWIQFRITSSSSYQGTYCVIQFHKVSTVHIIWYSYIYIYIACKRRIIKEMTSNAWPILAYKTINSWRFKWTENNYMWKLKIPCKEEIRFTIRTVISNWWLWMRCLSTFLYMLLKRKRRFVLFLNICICARFSDYVMMIISTIHSKLSFNGITANNNKYQLERLIWFYISSQSIKTMQYAIQYNNSEIPWQYLWLYMKYILGGNTSNNL